jgi:hypothetical protein
MTKPAFKSLEEKLSPWAYLIRKESDGTLVQTKTHRDLLQIFQVGFESGGNLYNLYVMEKGLLVIHSREMTEESLVEEVKSLAEALTQDVDLGD